MPIKSSPITLKTQVIENGVAVSTKSTIKWRLKLAWQGTYKTYQSVLDLVGNSITTQISTGGILYIKATALISGETYSNSIKVFITGNNPTNKLLGQSFPNNLLKAIAWQESAWRQFNSEGKPLKNPHSSMVGLMQISERWWGTDKSSIKSNDFNRIAWDWSYNIQAAREILDYYFKRVVNKYPDEPEESQWNRALKAYHAGESTIKTKESANDFWYVKQIRKHIKGKPWEKQ